MTTTLAMKPDAELAAGIKLPSTDGGDLSDMPMIDMGVKEPLPDTIVNRGRQHVVTVMDNSTSMGGSKIAELNVAVQALVRALADPKNRKGFRVSTILFNSSAQRMALGECATTLNVAPAQSMGGTDFEHALNEALTAISDFKDLPNPEGWADRRPVVLFMSDGQSNASQSTIDALKETAEVICVAFGDDADRSVLSQISSDGNVHKVGTKGGELRKLLADVGKTLSETYQNNA